MLEPGGDPRLALKPRSVSGSSDSASLSATVRPSTVSVASTTRPMPPRAISSTSTCSASPAASPAARPSGIGAAVFGITVAERCAPSGCGAAVAGRIGRRAELHRAGLGRRRRCGNVACPRRPRSCGRRNRRRAVRGHVWLVGHARHASSHGHARVGAAGRARPRGPAPTRTSRRSGQPTMIVTGSTYQ